MFDADRPIENSSQDRLNRSQFAKYLARCILDHPDPDSFVVGLYGGWGVGKTSVINMVVEELNFAATNIEGEDYKPIILNFSPWSYSGQDQLLYNFFRRLSSVLRQAKDNNQLYEADRIIDLLELYVSFFTNRPIPQALEKQPLTLWQKMFGQKAEPTHAWESGRDLTLVKQELNELLSLQNCKIIIIIDNITRLQDIEIKQIFQIVKSIGNFTNTRYLLAFQKNRVVHAVNRLDGGGGEGYVEKIIQLPFTIPAITMHDLETILEDRLAEIHKMVPEGTWHTEHWADIYFNSLKYFFENCRDITRYVNTLHFSYSRLRDVVNPVDFFALTALEIFTPDVYAGIQDNKDLFTDLLDHVYDIQEDEIKKDRSRCDEILSRNTRYPNDMILELLMYLFPRVRHLYYPDMSFYHSDTIARKLKRICSPDLFDAYFRLSMQSGEIPEAEFNTILSMSSSKEAFDHTLTRLNQDDRIIKFLDQLDNKRILDKIPSENISAVVAALLDNGDLFPHGDDNPLGLSTAMRIHRIIHGLLRRLNQEERFDIMHDAIDSSTKSLYIIIHELIEQHKEHTEDEDTFLPVEFRDIKPTQLRDLQKFTNNRIAYWAAHGRLSEHPQLLQILYAWLNWGGEEECTRFIVDLTKTDPGLVVFLTAVFEDAIDQAITNYQQDESWHRCLEDIEDFISASSLESRAKQIFEDGYFEKLREREQLAIMIFLDMMHSDTRKAIPKTTA